MYIPSYSPHQLIPLPSSLHNNSNTPAITLVTDVDHPHVSPLYPTQHQNTPALRTPPYHPTPPDNAINTRSHVTSSHTPTNITYPLS